MTIDPLVTSVSRKWRVPRLLRKKRPSQLWSIALSYRFRLHLQRKRRRLWGIALQDMQAHRRDDLDHRLGICRETASCTWDTWSYLGSVTPSTAFPPLRRSRRSKKMWSELYSAKLQHGRQSLRVKP